MELMYFMERVAIADVERMALETQIASQQPLYSMYTRQTRLRCLESIPGFLAYSRPTLHLFLRLLSASRGSSFATSH